MSRVLLLHTGGTLGMKGSPLEPGEFQDRLAEYVPEIEQLADVTTRVIANLDSSDIGPAHWTDLAQAIDEDYESYDGFVVVHGTDTMAYSASALAFALENLGKPVVFTGAQRPLSAVRSDAPRNLTDAVDLATRDIPEVGICFDGLFIRGCRATKTSAQDYRGFDSRECPPLAKLGVDVSIADHVLRRAGEYRCDARFDPEVIYIQVTPGLRPERFEAILQTGVKGVVLSAFGLGTIPSSNGPLGPVVADAVASGIEVLVVTASTGNVDFGLYRNSLPLRDAGAISGGTMHMEASISKLMHALAVYDDRDERRVYLERNVAGERD